MDEPRRWSSLREPLKGAGYVIALAVLVSLVGTVLAVTLVWLMT
jgi:hypothetical protein